MTANNPSAGAGVRKHFEILADVLYRRFRTVEALLPSSHAAGAAHTAEEGRHVESLLRNLLNEHLPAELRAYSGFILRPATKIGDRDLDRLSEGDKRSTQLDIIVYNRARFPIYEQFEEFAVVPPEGVVGVISVKKTLYLSALGHEIQALIEAARTCRGAPGERGPHLGVFAFQAEPGRSAKQLWEGIACSIKDAYSEKMEFSHLLNEVTVLDQLAVFKWGPIDSPPGYAKYAWCRHEGNEFPRHIAVERVIQSVLSVYYARNGATRPGFVSFAKGTFGEPFASIDVAYAPDNPA